MNINLLNDKIDHKHQGITHVFNFQITYTILVIYVIKGESNTLLLKSNKARKHQCHRLLVIYS